MYYIKNDHVNTVMLEESGKYTVKKKIQERVDVILDFIS